MPKERLAEEERRGPTQKHTYTCQTLFSITFVSIPHVSIDLSSLTSRNSWLLLLCVCVCVCVPGAGGADHETGRLGALKNI